MRSCSRFLATAGAVVADLTPASAAPAKVSSSTTNIQRVKLGLNKSVVIDLPSDAYDILVANPTVADAVTRTARRIYLFGKAVGETNIFVFGPNGEQIVNLLQIVGDDQVMLKVTVAEVSRNVMKQLGVNMLANGSTDGIKWGIDNAMPGGIGAPMVGGSGNFSLSRNGIGASISAMEQAGVLKTLAEPTLTAVLGEQATFRVGGEFNLLREVEPPKRDKDGVTDPGGLRYNQIEYGISLYFKKVVLSPGRISLKVRTAISEPTNESPGLGGSNPMLPSLRKRLADTTVELPSGGSMMIAGLVRDDVKQVIGGVPGLSKVPILGTLFRSRDFIRNETERVIIVTPYLARPVARNELAKPADNFSIASDGAGIFLGRVNQVYGTMKTDKPMGRYHGVVGFIYK